MYSARSDSWAAEPGRREPDAAERRTSSVCERDICAASPSFTVGEVLLCGLGETTKPPRSTTRPAVYRDDDRCTQQSTARASSERVADAICGSEAVPPDEDRAISTIRSKVAVGTPRDCESVAIPTRWCDETTSFVAARLPGGFGVSERMRYLTAATHSIDLWRTALRGGIAVEACPLPRRTSALSFAIGIGRATTQPCFSYCGSGVNRIFSADSGTFLAAGQKPLLFVPNAPREPRLPPPQDLYPFRANCLCSLSLSIVGEKK